MQIEVESSSLSALTQGFPTSGPWTCQISSSISLEIKCPIYVIHLNHPQTIPLPFQSMEKFLPQCQTLVPKRLGTTTFNKCFLMVEGVYWPFTYGKFDVEMFVGHGHIAYAYKLPIIVYSLGHTSWSLSVVVQGLRHSNMLLDGKTWSQVKHDNLVDLYLKTCVCSTWTSPSLLTLQILGKF